MPILEPFSHSLPTNPAIWSHCPPTYTHPYFNLPPCGPASRHNSNKTPAQRSRIIPSSKREEKRILKPVSHTTSAVRFAAHFGSVVSVYVWSGHPRQSAAPGVAILHTRRLKFYVEFFIIHAYSLNCSPVAYSESPEFKPGSRPEQLFALLLILTRNLTLGHDRLLAHSLSLYSLSYL